MREVLRSHHSAIRTEEAYVAWVYTFIKFHRMRHPREMGKSEKEILDKPMDEQLEPIQSQRSKKFPTVLSRAEVRRLLNAMEGTSQLMAKLLYGSG
ncbi:MAG: phage integrase N-terminal SAM-like domain-containing protein [Candidatus Tectomicrobia bacterium]|nr:phage integrase N-terminal SAM-like domain-containing protein [Candidatus Tectomicrobia bacterium]